MFSFIISQKVLVMILLDFYPHFLLRVYTECMLIHLSSIPLYPVDRVTEWAGAYSRELMA